MADRTTFKIFVASSNELREEREKCIFLFNKIGKLFTHLHLEPVHWEYDIVHSTYPKFKDAQNAINENLKECQLAIFIFYSRIGKYTLEEFRLANKLKKDSFIFFKTGFSPNTQQLESYGELRKFIDGLDGKAFPINYLDIPSFELSLTDNLSLYLSKKHSSIKEDKGITTSQFNQLLIQWLAEKDNAINILKKNEKKLPNSTLHSELQKLNHQREAIEQKLLESNEIRDSWAKDKDALEKQLSPQIGHDPLKAKALQEVKKENYLVAENYLIESAKSNVKETLTALSQANQSLLGKLVEKEKVIWQVEESTKEFQYNKIPIVLQELMEERENIKNELVQSEEIRKRLAKDKEELEKKLVPQIEVDNLKAKAFEEVKKGNYEEANNYLMESTKESVKEVASTYFELGNLKKLQMQFGEALNFYELAAKTNPENSKYLNRAGEIANDMGFYNKAIEYYEKALAIDIELYGESHQNIAIRYNNIGSAYINKGEYDKAIKYYEKALLIDKYIYGDDNHHEIASRYNNIGLAYSSKGDYNKAIEYYDKSLAIDKKIRNEDHPDFAKRFNNIGLVYNYKGDYDKALEYYEKALVIDRKNHGEEHADISIRYSNIGTAYTYKGEYDKAIEYHQKALVIDKKIYGDNHPAISTAYSNLGLTYIYKGEYNKAILYYEKTLVIDKEFHGDEHPDIAISYVNIGKAYSGIRDYNKAIEFCQKGLSMLLKFFPESHINIQATKLTIEQIKEEQKKNNKP